MLNPATELHIPGNSTVRVFEAKFAALCSKKYCISTCSATAAILSTFYALGLSGGEVITTPLTWPGAITPLLALGCKVRFVDVHPNTLTINPELIEGAITSTTKAVFSSDFLGYPCALDQIASICHKHKLLLIHDAASSLGSLYRGKQSGYFADVSIYSFGSKKLFSLGEGGAIVVNRKYLYHRLANVLWHPERQDSHLTNVNPLFLNLPLHPLAAQVGCQRLMDSWAAIRKRALSISSYCPLFKLGKYEPNYYKIVVGDSANLSSELSALPFSPIYKLKQFRDYISACCPVAEQAYHTHFILSTDNLI